MGNGAAGAHRRHHLLVHRARLMATATSSPSSMRFRSLIRRAVELPWAETMTTSTSLPARCWRPVKQLIPDIKGAVANVLYSLFYKMSRSTSRSTTTATAHPDFRSAGSR